MESREDDIMVESKTLSEAKRLHSLGLAVHWVRPKSKVPLESKWTTGPRAEGEYLKRTYSAGLNVGVRLGEPSQIGENFLACIDVDVKTPKFKAEALECLKQIIGDKKMPTVLSGSGNGSRHLYCVTKAPFKMITVGKSEGTFKDAEGRKHHDWEICVYSSGRQMILPPSTHPDTGKHYEWARALSTDADLPVMEFEAFRANRVEPVKSAGDQARKARGETDFEFTPVEVDLDNVRISRKMKDAIIEGRGVKDRSAFLLPACSALRSAGLGQNEILSILTDPKHFLSGCAYDHAKTSDRERAAFWLWRYTLERVMRERDPASVFTDAPIEEAKKLSNEERAAQDEEFAEIIGWQSKLERSKEFKVRNTMKNCKTILENVFGNDCVRFNEFANTEEMHGEFPWLVKTGKEIYDIDITMVKDWFTKKWGYEPSDEKIRSAISVIAFENKYHPVKQWLGALPVWDEVDRIDSLLTRYIPCEGDPELRAVAGRRFMVALVKRIFEPGSQSDYVMILEGAQGIQKSSAFRALVGDDWFSDAAFNVEDKDAVMVIFSKWLIEFGELSSLDKTTAEHTKAFITRRSDRIRAPFDRKAKDYPRQCLFVGSTNKDQYLKDDTGARRFWPFKVEGVCNVQAIAKDREQLFAEALYYYEINEPTYLREVHLETKMKAQQGTREMHDVLIEQVAEVLHSMEKLNGGMKPFSMLDLFTTGKLTGVKLDQYATNRLGAILRKLGYEKRKETTGARTYLWEKLEPEGFK